MKTVRFHPEGLAAGMDRSCVVSRANRLLRSSLGHLCLMTAVLLSLLSAAGCQQGVPARVQHRIQHFTADPADCTSTAEAEVLRSPLNPVNTASAELSVNLTHSRVSGASAHPKRPVVCEYEQHLLDLVSHQSPVPVRASLSDSKVQPTKRFEIPPELPGADAEPIRLPPFDPAESPEVHREQVRNLYRALPPLSESFAQGVQSKGEREFSLADLQRMAIANSPTLQLAATEVERLRGLAIQAGAYPNPVAGYQSDTVNTGRSFGYQGGFVSQEFVTADKLDLQQNAALMQQRSAEIALQKARIQLVSAIRSDYFQVLIALKKIELSRALVELTNQIYEAQIGLVEGGEAAPYEPLQLRVFAIQTRNSVLRFENEYRAAWRSLAATLGTPDLPATRLVDSVEAAVPDVNYDRALAYLLAHHTDLAIVQTQISRAGFNLELQRVTPVPNINVQTSLFHDDTSALNDTAYSIQIGVPLPIFNRNRGNIVSAEAQILQARQQYGKTRNVLTSELAEAFARYSSNKHIVESYRTSILPDQMLTYRGIYSRFLQVGEDIDFAQVVVSQQTLFDALTDYIDALSAQWLSAVEIARITQIDDLMTMGRIIGSPETQTPADGETKLE